MSGSLLSPIAPIVEHERDRVRIDKENENENENHQEEGQDEKDEVQAEVRSTTAWSNRGIFEERELSPDDDDQLPVPLVGTKVALSPDGVPHHLIHTSEISVSSVGIELSTPTITKDGDAMEPKTVSLLTREETVKQDLDFSPRSHGLDADMKSEIRPKIKLDEESELCNEPVSSNTFTKPHPPRHVDSSTVAIPPAFQALPAHIPTNFYATRSHPWNRSGFRYLACGPPARSNAQNPYDEISIASDRYPVYYTIETVPEHQVKWAWEDRSNYVYITKDGLAVTTDRGFRSARANLPIRQGRIYFEVILECAGGELNSGPRSELEQAHVRIGLARRESGLNGPVGIDGYSYGIRDKTGEKVHLSKLQPYGDRFGSGDVIGVYVDLPPLRSPIPNDPHDPARIERRRIPIRYRRQLYFESPEYPASKEMEDLAEAASPSKLKPKPEFHSTLPPPPAVKKPIPGQKQVLVPTPIVPDIPAGVVSRELPVLKGSKLVFFKNGVCQGVAFKDLLDFLPLRAHATSSYEKAVLNLANGQMENAVLDPSNSQARDHLHDDGTMGYYPCVSVYGGGIARLNPGPDFKFPPMEDIEAYLEQNTPLSTGIPTHSSSRDKLSEDSQRNTNDSGSRNWQALSSLYPVYMAEQRELDRADAIECQRRLMVEAKLAEEAEEKALKRRRVSSPTSRPVSPTGTPSSSNVHGTKASKPKKKIKGNISSHLNTGSLNSQRSQSFKPSPLGLIEVADKSPPPIQPETGPATLNGNSTPAINLESNSAVTSLTHISENSYLHPSLGLLSAVATETVVLDPGSTANLTDDSGNEPATVQELTPKPIKRIDDVNVNRPEHKSIIDPLLQPSTQEQDLQPDTASNPIPAAFSALDPEIVHHTFAQAALTTVDHKSSNPDLSVIVPSPAHLLKIELSPRFLTRDPPGLSVSEVNTSTDEPSGPTSPSPEAVQCDAQKL